MSFSRRLGYQAHAYASTRGSAPALNTPVSESNMMTAFEPIDQGGGLTP